MAVSAAPSSIGAALASRRGLTALIFIAIAAAMAAGLLYRGAYPGSVFGSPAADALREKIHQGVGGMKTVADMLLGRSPGERAVGALANLKHKPVASPHERALPKLRNAPPVSPLAAILGAPVSPLPPVAPAVGTPLYNVVTTLPPIAESPPATLFPAMPPLPPGGGLIIPPVVTQIVPPSPPSPPPPVPEPGSWAMMLIGFVFIGRIFRARPRRAFIVT